MPPSNHREGLGTEGEGQTTQREKGRQRETEEEPSQGRALGEDEGWGRRASPEKRARKPWVRELMTSISCRDTVCTTSLRFWSSPSGHCTNLVCGAAWGGGVETRQRRAWRGPTGLCLGEIGAPWKGAGNPDGGYLATPGPEGS